MKPLVPEGNGEVVIKVKDLFLNLLFHKTYGIVYRKGKTYFRNYHRPIKNGVTLFEAIYAILPDEFPPLFNQR